MKARLILNPASGSNSGPEYLQEINQQLRPRLGELDIVLTTGPGDAAQAARQAAEAGYPMLLVAGGDGTLNEALNGVADVPGALERTVFGLLPLGTGNDFARALGIPEDPEEALALLGGRSIAVDLGALNGRRFVNVSAGGFIAEVSEATTPELKTVAGKLAYLLAGAQTLMDYEPVGFRLRGETPDGPLEREAQLSLFAVCNSRMVGGGRLIAPAALIDDGWLDVCLVEPMPMLEFVALLARVSGGGHLEDERVTYFRARRLELAFDRQINVNTDGEVLKTALCQYSVQQRFVRFYAGEPQFTTAAVLP